VPTIFSHSLAAVALGSCFPERKLPVRFWVLAAICAALPDADVLGFTLGLSRDDVLSHRGFTHSLFFAACIGFLIVIAFFSGIDKLSKHWWMLVAFFFAVTASHGLLDAMTNGGRGVAFFAPFSDARYFFPWRPIEVSPLGIDRFLSARGLEVMLSEFKWIWLPSGVVAFGAFALRILFKDATTVNKRDEF
jgi:inner membrane protein